MHFDAVALGARGCRVPWGCWSSAGIPGLSMVVVRTDNLIGTPTLDDPKIVDDRTRHHAPRVRE
jgi:hypothetical protein